MKILKSIIWMVLPGVACMLSVLLAVCAPRSRPTELVTQVQQSISLNGTEWLLSSFNGKPPVPGSRITLEFEPDSLGGYSGCNWYGGAYTTAGTTLAVQEISGTARGCAAPAGIGKQESAYYRALRQVAAYGLIGNRLDLKSHTDELLLSFIRREPLAMDPADLVGTRWQLQSVNQRPPPTEVAITLSFSKDGLSGFAGCRGYTGTYVAEGDDIRVTSISMSETECGKGDALLLFEGQYTTDLSEAEHYRLDSDALEIATAPGRALVFAAQRRE
jgi:heat shock protein HslJ